MHKALSWAIAAGEEVNNIQIFILGFLCLDFLKIFSGKSKQYQSVVLYLLIFDMKQTRFEGVRGIIFFHELQLYTTGTISKALSSGTSSLCTGR